MPRPFLAAVVAMLAVLAVYFGVGSQLHDHWRVETTRTLPVTVAQLQREVGDLSRWSQWCRMDVTLGATTECQASGTPGTKEQALTWRGSRGRVVLQLTTYDANHGLEYELSMQRSDGNGGVLGTGGIAWSPVEHGTRVSWHEAGVFDSYPARWSGWFGALQQHVRDNQEASLGGLSQSFDAPK